MYNIGDKIVYGMSGLFVVEDIRDEVVLGTKRTYYVLRSASEKSASLSFVPTDNEALVSNMRYPLTPEAAEKFIREIAGIEPAPWLPDTRKRSEKYRELLESGRHENIVAVIKSVREKEESRIAEGKKTFVSDENIMKKAKELLYSELAEALGLPEDQVEQYINEHE